MTLYLLCAATTAINIPFGYMRAGHRRYSWPWLLAVHLPVPLIIIMRLLSNQGWGTVPVLVICAIIGQLAGGMLRSSKRRRTMVEEKQERA
jgi:hypothetical protein